MVIGYYEQTAAVIILNLCRSTIGFSTRLLVLGYGKFTGSADFSAREEPAFFTLTNQ
jgi:hypothetical protein